LTGRELRFRRQVIGNCVVDIIGREGLFLVGWRGWIFIGRGRLLLGSERVAGEQSEGGGRAEQGGGEQQRREETAGGQDG
jgi:hypothetical protein